jgi:AhpC/TSA family
MRKAAVIVWLAILLTGIVTLFWQIDWKYNLPTPVPDNYKTIAIGSVVELPQKLKQEKGKPLFLHFFNPHCPCSRFNISHFKSLVTQYGSEIDFKIVVLSTKTYTEKEIQDKFDLQLPVLFDSSIAASCGVYSTPQAVILDTSHRLYYRGNYNRSRYCSNRSTEYARIALDAFLHTGLAIAFDQFALKAYGCQLPKCNN